MGRMKDRPWPERVELVNLEQNRLAAAGIVALAEEREWPAGLAEEPSPMVIHRQSLGHQAIYSQLRLLSNRAGCRAARPGGD